MKKILFLSFIIVNLSFGQSITISPTSTNTLIEKTNGTAEQTIRGIASGSAGSSGNSKLNLESNYIYSLFGAYANSAINFNSQAGNEFSITNYTGFYPLNGTNSVLSIRKGNSSLATFDTYGIAMAENKGIGFGIKSIFPITMDANLGDKISLGGLTVYGSGYPSGPHNGMGLQNNLFQIFSKSNTDDIAFGYGESTAFTENIRIKGNGKVGFGNSTPNLNTDERIEINGRLRIRDSTSTAGVWFNNSANSSNYVDGAFHGMLNNTNTGIFIGGGWRFWVNNAGNTTITGFTQLGNGVPSGAAAGATAPLIKTMKLTGTTSSASGGGVFLAHGLTNASKVLSYSVLVYGNALSVFPPEYSYNTGYQYSTYCSNTSIHILNSVGNSSNILNKTFTVLITYEE